MTQSDTKRSSLKPQIHGSGLNQPVVRITGEQTATRIVRDGKPKSKMSRFDNRNDKSSLFSSGSKANPEIRMASIAKNPFI